MINLENQIEQPISSSNTGVVKAISKREVKTWLLAWLVNRDYYEDSRINEQTPFAEIGLSSIDAVELSVELSQAVGINLDSTIAWHYPNIELLAEHISEQTLEITDQTATLELNLVGASEVPSNAMDFSGLDEQAIADLLKTLFQSERHTAR